MAEDGRFVARQYALGSAPHIRAEKMVTELNLGIVCIC
jgi:hypothetical protein